MDPATLQHPEQGIYEITIDALSPELIIHIASFLSPKDRISLSSTCKSWQGCTRSADIWNDELFPSIDTIVKHLRKGASNLTEQTYFPSFHRWLVTHPLATPTVLRLHASPQDFAFVKKLFKCNLDRIRSLHHLCVQAQTSPTREELGAHARWNDHVFDPTCAATDVINMLPRLQELTLTLGWDDLILHSAFSQLTHLSHLDIHARTVNCHRGALPNSLRHLALDRCMFVSSEPYQDLIPPDLTYLALHDVDTPKQTRNPLRQNMREERDYGWILTARLRKLKTLSIRWCPGLNVNVIMNVWPGPAMWNALPALECFDMSGRSRFKTRLMGANSSGIGGGNSSNTANNNNTNNSMNLGIYPQQSTQLTSLFLSQLQYFHPLPPLSKMPNLQVLHLHWSPGFKITPQDLRSILKIKELSFNIEAWHACHCSRAPYVPVGVVGWERVMVYGGDEREGGSFDARSRTVQEKREKNAQVLLTLFSLFNAASKLKCVEFNGDVLSGCCDEYRALVEFARRRPTVELSFLD